jgi:glycine/D-amino acid oxidase-like deaminating enzyme
MWAASNSVFRSWSSKNLVSLLRLRNHRFASNAPVWKTSKEQILPELDSVVDADVCVIGLGGSGLACIQELVQKKHKVVGLDANSVAAEAAGRNGGFLLAGISQFYHHAVKKFGVDRATAMYRLTLSEMDRMTADCPDAIRRMGSLRIAMSEEELLDCDEQYEAMLSADLPVDRYTGLEGTGLLFPQDGVFNPVQRHHMTAARCLAAGARLYQNSSSISISGNEVQTTRGRVRCNAVVVAVDGKLAQVRLD